jgi:hypothetical protein
MSATNGFETSLLNLIFTNTNNANIGDATGLRGSTTAGSFYIALYSTDPTETGAAGNELSYTGYGRVAVARTTSAFDVTSADATNKAILNFGQCTVGSGTANYFGIHTAVTGGDCLFYGPIQTPLSIVVGVIPSLAIGALKITAN